jgi:hypothetical protein
MEVDISDSIGDPKNYHLVITTTEWDDAELLGNFLNGSGGAMGSNEEIAPPLRRLLEKSGIGIPVCSAFVGTAAAATRRRRRSSARPTY